MKKLLKKINYLSIVSLVMAFIGMFLALILLTYDTRDTSFFYKSLPSPFVYHTWVSYIGSYCASLIFFLFGIASYLLIPFFFMSAYLIMMRTFTVERVIGFVVCVSSFATFVHRCDVEQASLGYAGGLFGIVGNTLLSFLFDQTIAWIFLCTLFVIGVVLSWELPCIWLSRLSMRTMQRIHNNIPYSMIFRPLTVVRICIAKGKKIIQSIMGYEVFKEQEKVVFEDLVSQAWYQEYSNAGWKTNEEQRQEESKKQSLDTHFYELEEEHDKKQEDSVQQQHKEIKYQIPNPADFFKLTKATNPLNQTKNVQHMARTLEEKLERFGIQGKVVSINSGPVITLFEYEPHIESKISKIVALEDDLALALEALSIRIIAPIPGKSVVGFEVAYQQRREVLLADLLISKEFATFEGKLPLIMGENTTGDLSIIDLMRAPHILVAGSTGSGKSVALNTMIISLLCKHNPSTLKFILIDPKRLEFSAYADIPHLMFPIITEARKAVIALQWVVRAMQERYELMETMNVRNMSEYNEAVTQQERLPFIVIIIDELADLMMSVGKEIEDLIARIAQMARAAGIHMIVATQRPSVDVITGLIKVNFPSRIAFKVTSKIDSRVILDCMGADKLLGKGDMLYLNASTQLHRLHGAFMTNEHIEKLVSYCKEQQKPSYVDMSFMHVQSVMNDDEDNLFQEVVEFLKTVDEISISLLQRKFRIGYNRAARIVELLEEQGFIMRDVSGKTRKVIRSS